MKFAIILLLIFVNNLASARIIEVCPNCPIETIESAYEQAIDGDEIKIKGGTYEIENLKINKRISMTGVNNPHIISKSGEEIITVAAKGVTISNITFSGVQTSYMKENAAIRLLRTKDFIISENTFKDCFFAIYVEKGKRGIIRNNTIIGNAKREADSGNGIHAWYCDSLSIIGNEVTKHRDGIYFEFVNNSMVKLNHSYGNLRYGLHFMFSNDDEYVENKFVDNGVGVAVMFSRRITMKENEFIHNWGNSAYGLLLKEIFDAEITGNTFKENTVGIFVEGSNRINYSFNDFISNGWAIKFSGGCEANKIVNNNFLYNSFEMLVSSKMQDNILNGNYWSSYTGYDLDKDGFGDVPHYPVKLYSYMLNQVPESVVLMRSLFVDLVNFAEKISPVFTPKDVFDSSPKMSQQP